MFNSKYNTSIVFLMTEPERNEYMALLESSIGKKAEAKSLLEEADQLKRKAEALFSDVELRVKGM